MIDISSKDRKRIVYAIEYLIAHGDTVTVNQMLKDCRITAKEYRVISDIAMPALRQHAERYTDRHRAAFYKGRYNRKLDKAEDILDKFKKGGTVNESDLRILAARDREDFVPASRKNNDGEEGHPEEWAI